MKEQGGRLDYFLRVPGIIATSSLIRIRVNNDALEPSLSFFAEKVATPGLLRDAGCLPHYFFRKENEHFFSEEIMRQGSLFGWTLACLIISSGEKDQHFSLMK